MDIPVYDAVENVRATVNYYGGGIKSVQRGQTVATVEDKETTITIPIATVDTSKATLQWSYGNAGVTSQKGAADALSALSVVLNANSITIKMAAFEFYEFEAVVFWQVVEYY